MKTLLYVAANARYLNTHRRRLIEAASKQYRVVIIAPDAKDYFDLPNHVIHINRMNMNPLKEIATLWNLFQIYRQEKPDIVHHIGLKPALLGDIVAKLCSIKTVVHSVSGLGKAFDFALTRFVIRFIMRLFWRHSTVIVQNSYDENIMTMPFVRVVRTAGAGVDLGEFTPPNVEPANKPFVVTLAARLLMSKGIDTFVEAIRRLKSEGLFIEGHLVGGIDPDHPDRVTLNQLESWVHIITWLGQHDDMVSIYQKSHVVVLPTRYREGIPKVLIEAAACGRPLISTHQPGCDEIVRHGVNGFLISSVDELVDCIRELYANLDLRIQMGQASRLHAEKNFDDRDVIQTTLELYKL